MTLTLVKLPIAVFPSNYDTLTLFWPTCDAWWRARKTESALRGTKRQMRRETLYALTHNYVSTLIQGTTVTIMTFKS